MAEIDWLKLASSAVSGLLARRISTRLVFCETALDLLQERVSSFDVCSLAQILREKSLLTHCLMCQ